jgi:carbon storage regulator CsrA
LFRVSKVCELGGVEMLVLSRREGESIEFRDLNVCVRVIQLKKSKVQLGVDAPRSIQVDRSEVLDRGDEVGYRSDQQNLGRFDGKSDRRKIKTKSSESEQRLMDELAKLEVEVMTLAELVTSKDQDLARQTALVSLERLKGLRNILRGVSTAHAVPQSISEFIQSRQYECGSTEPVSKSTHVGVRQDCDGLNSTTNPQSQTDCLRQTGVGYFLESEVPDFSDHGTFEAGRG